MIPGMEKLIDVLLAMSSRMEEEKDYLTDLDNATGDGDHGINMARGFKAVAEKAPVLSGMNDVGAVLKTVGMTLVSVVGGSAGPLYGTAFMKAGMEMSGKAGMDMQDFLACMKAAVDGVMMRGRAVRGEKTMLDSMIPAYEAMRDAFLGGKPAGDCFAAGLQAAREGVEYTKSIIATKGRASYIGERSLGYMDPGAVSFTLLLETIADSWSE